eukprot:CAMPEP_0185731430 /NCGR_PEP_ID=MMETSP1171-20130828/12887_1 /TAXON_ID=374046 /ORGANISM="Helicotheca tamensis, Strain CCMP826" /LENGTH=551 /DNA_ID=CAMNT_0028400693 /DNA_START=36 /DNA_END=1691 /DNA_ORIENTATION=-
MRQTQTTNRMMAAMFNNSGAELYEQGRFYDSMQLFKEARKSLSKDNETNSQSTTSKDNVMNGREHDQQQGQEPLNCASSCTITPGFQDYNATERPQQKQQRDIAHGMYREEKEDDLGTEYFDTPFRISLGSNIYPGFDCPIVLYNLGIVHRSLGHIDMAVEYFELCIALLPQRIIKFEPLAIAALNNVGTIHYESGMHDEAMCDFLQAVRFSADMPVADDPASSIAGISNNCPVASAEETDCSPRASKRPRLSAKATNKAKEFTLEERWLLYQAITLSNIGRVDFCSNRFDDALTSCKAALCIRTKVLGSDHFDTAIIRYNIGLIAHKQGQLGVALPCYKEFVDLASKLHGPGVAHVATALHQVSLIHSARGKKELALFSLENVLNVRKKLHGEYHRDTAKTYFSMGQINIELGRINEASKAFQESLRIAHVVFPEQHIIFVFAFCYMGQIHHLNGNAEDALNSYEHALPIARSLFGNEHYLVINILNIIGNYWVAQGDLVAASSIFDEASSIYVRFIMISGQLQQLQRQSSHIGGQAKPRKCVKFVAKSA